MDLFVWRSCGMIVHLYLYRIWKGCVLLPHLCFLKHPIRVYHKGVNKSNLIWSDFIMNYSWVGILQKLLKSGFGTFNNSKLYSPQYGTILMFNHFRYRSFISVVEVAIISLHQYLINRFDRKINFIVNILSTDQINIKGVNYLFVSYS